MCERERERERDRERRLDWQTLLSKWNDKEKDMNREI